MLRRTLGQFCVFRTDHGAAELWNQGIAKLLLAQMVAIFDRWGVRQAALFTFPQSPRHIGLYQKFGFWPRYLTPVMSKPVQKPRHPGEALLFSKLPPAERAASLRHCAEITDRVFPGLDVRSEILSIDDQRLGETILISDTHGLAGFAACHIGAGSEAGTGTLFVKFAAVRPGHAAPEIFARLLDACETSPACPIAARFTPAFTRPGIKPTGSCSTAGFGPFWKALPCSGERSGIQSAGPLHDRDLR